MSTQTCDRFRRQQALSNEVCRDSGVAEHAPGRSVSGKLGRPWSWMHAVPVGSSRSAGSSAQQASARSCGSWSEHDSPTWTTQRAFTHAGGVLPVVGHSATTSRRAVALPDSSSRLALVPQPPRLATAAATNRSRRRRQIQLPARIVSGRHRRFVSLSQGPCTLVFPIDLATERRRESA